MAKVMCGADVLRLSSIDGKTVSEVRALYRGTLNIPDGAVALLNGEEAEEDDVLGENDELEFVRPAGKKGC